MDKVVAVIRKNKSEDIRVSLSEWEGHNLVNVRIWAEHEGATEARLPTKKGIVLQISRLPELITALEIARDEATAAGLLKAPTTASEVRVPATRRNSDRAMQAPGTATERVIERAASERAAGALPFDDPLPA